MIIAVVADGCCGDLGLAHRPGLADSRPTAPCIAVSAKSNWLDPVVQGVHAREGRP